MEKGRDGAGRETIQLEAVLQTSGFSDEADEEDREMETPCGFSGPRETHCPIRSKSLSTAQKRQGFSQLEKNKPQLISVASLCLIHGHQLFWEPAFLNGRASLK